MKRLISLFMSVVLVFTMSVGAAAVELEPNTDAVFTNDVLIDEDTNISFDDLSEEDQIFLKKMTLIYDGYDTNEAGEIIFTYSTEDLRKLGFTEKEIERLNEINEIVCGTILVESDRIPTNPVQPAMFVKDWKIWFTYDDVMRILVPAATMGADSLYAAIVALSTAIGGVVGGGLATALGIVGVPSLGYLCYLALQAGVNHQGVYIGVEMNGAFPIIDCGTW